MFTGIAKDRANGQTIGLGVSMPVLINLVLCADKLPFDLDSFDYLAMVARAQLAIIARSSRGMKTYLAVLSMATNRCGLPSVVRSSAMSPLMVCCANHCRAADMEVAASRRWIG